MDDITIMKIEATQLGYLCCVELNNCHEQGEFEHQLSELGVVMPNTEQIKVEVVQEIISISHAYIYIYIYIYILLYIWKLPYNCILSSCFV